MDLSRNDLVIPVSGWVPNIDPGKKCLHGVYISSTQEHQGYSEMCGICTSLISFCETTGLTPEQANLRVYYWTNFSHKEAEERIRALQNNSNSVTERTD